ncbi:hypothetical protein F2Q68_00014657 [Brassica cretica]|uniref:Uncharacterized protein n=1 Tax=Brassica cretica TaxID=69181 RepID=A0A8S9HND5_BRACR|nr:hypothetical protein F2Q68_00014657 [Brassica cretica]
MYEGVLHRVSCFITLEEDKSAYVAKDKEMKSLVTAKAVGAYHESQQHSKQESPSTLLLARRVFSHSFPRSRVIAHSHLKMRVVTHSSCHHVLIPERGKERQSCIQTVAQVSESPEFSVLPQQSVPVSIAASPLWRSVVNIRFKEEFIDSFCELSPVSKKHQQHIYGRCCKVKRRIEVLHGKDQGSSV